jgi:hypothetical protein
VAQVVMMQFFLGGSSLVFSGVKGQNMYEIFSLTDKPFGISYYEWTERWWQWFFSMPKLNNPILDTTGQHAGKNQPYKDVLFLAGKVADNQKTVPNRICEIPTGRAVLFPVVNCEANPLEYPRLLHQELLEHVRRDAESTNSKECYVNGQSIPVQRIGSKKEFDLRIVDDNIIGVKGGNTSAIADGWWVFLKPLPLGNYEILFRGSCEFGKLNSGARYVIKIA